MNNYYYACGGSCNGPVQIQSGNRAEADQLAEEECGCVGGGCCQYLGCDGINCNGNIAVTEEQRNFRPSPDFLAKARVVRAR
jgi:hypothetical protein